MPNNAYSEVGVFYFYNSRNATSDIRPYLTIQYTLDAFVPCGATGTERVCYKLKIPARLELINYDTQLMRSTPLHPMPCNGSCCRGHNTIITFRLSEHSEQIFYWLSILRQST